MSSIFLLPVLIEKNGGNATWEKEADEYFTSRLNSPESWNSITSLNEVPLKDIRPGQLVRFRCMVQDQLGPEMYGSNALLKNTATGVEKTVTGKFKDELSLGVKFNLSDLLCMCGCHHYNTFHLYLQSDEEILNWNTTESRNCFYCVPVPGETPWAKMISFPNL